jgi:hypothetical protein
LAGVVKAQPRAEDAGEPSAPQNPGSRDASDAPASPDDASLDGQPASPERSGETEPAARPRTDPGQSRTVPRLQPAVASGRARRSQRAGAIGDERRVRARRALCRDRAARQCRTRPRALRDIANRSRSWSGHGDEQAGHGACRGRRARVITLRRHGTDARKWLAWWKWNRGRGRKCSSQGSRATIARRASPPTPSCQGGEAPSVLAGHASARARERAARIWAAGGHAPETCSDAIRPHQCGLVASLGLAMWCRDLVVSGDAVTSVNHGGVLPVLPKRKCGAHFGTARSVNARFRKAAGPLCGRSPRRPLVVTSPVGSRSEPWLRLDSGEPEMGAGTGCSSKTGRES